MDKLLIEINRKRNLMGLPILTESVGLQTIVGDVASGLESTTIKKTIESIVSKYSAKFQFPNQASRTKFINGGIKSLENAITKIPRKSVLEIIIDIDSSQIGKIITFIEQNEVKLYNQITDLSLKGVPENEIIGAFGELSDIPSSVVKTMIKRAQLKLFSPEMIGGFLKALNSSADLKKLTDDAISGYRHSNPGATPQQIAEYFVKKIPNSAYSTANIIKILRTPDRKVAVFLNRLFLNKKGDIRYGNVLGVSGGTILIGVLSYLYKAYGKTQLKDEIDLIIEKYPCYDGYITPSKLGGSFFNAEEEDGRRLLIKWDGKRAYYSNKNGVIAKELFCSDN
jgi:hypothetical protein